MAPVSIHRAGSGDLEVLVRLAAAFRDHLERTAPTDDAFRAGFATLLEDPGTEILIARDTDGAALGYVQARYRYSAWNTALDAELEDVFVTSAARRRGIGRDLVERAVRSARDKGCRVIGLNTNERNAAALALYARLGFVAERGFWDGARQLWLEKSLDDG